MDSTSSSTGLLEISEYTPGETPLRLCVEPADAPQPANPSVFSSIRQTAVALVTVATEQASQRSIPDKPAPRKRDLIRDEQALLRANAEQARRVSQCMRSAFESILRHTTQPGFGIDDSGAIAFWNGAMTQWTGIAPIDAIGRMLPELFPVPTADRIGDAVEAMIEFQDADPDPDVDPVFVLDSDIVLTGGRSATRISLFPLCRLPRMVETVIVLVTPETADP